MKTEEFFKFARERHNIWSRRHYLGEPAPWTDDPILLEYSFTNIYRELDKTTIWFRENIREELAGDQEDSIFSTIAFRWFNKIETGQRILDADKWMFQPGRWNSNRVRNILAGHTPYVTGAYIIKTPNGKNKLDGVLWCIDQIKDNLWSLAYDIDHCTTLQQAWEVLLPYPYMGPFMAYEVITDLRHTSVLDGAADINSWANPGPGCRRGLSRLLDHDKDHFRSAPTEALLPYMRELLKESHNEYSWSFTHSPPWEMREVEHTLCEWDKYERARLGQGRPKQRFTSAS